MSVWCGAPEGWVVLRPSGVAGPSARPPVGPVRWAGPRRELAALSRFPWRVARNSATPDRGTTQPPPGRLASFRRTRNVPPNASPNVSTERNRMPISSRVAAVTASLTLAGAGLLGLAAPASDDTPTLICPSRAEYIDGSGGHKGARISCTGASFFLAISARHGKPSRTGTGTTVTGPPRGARQRCGATSTRGSSRLTPARPELCSEAPPPAVGGGAFGAVTRPRALVPSCGRRVRGLPRRGRTADRPAASRRRAAGVAWGGWRHWSR